MQTYAEKSKAAGQTTSIKSTPTGRMHLGQSQEVGTILHSQRTNENQAVQRLVRTDAACFKVNSGARSVTRSAHDLSCPSGRTTLKKKTEKLAGHMSETLDAGGPTDAGVPIPAGVPAPAPAPPVTPPTPPPPGCNITTRTLAHAPDGTADSRSVVGVNEQVQMTSSASATWTASSGTFTPASGTTTVWTAPGTGGTPSVTATPTTAGSPCSVTMTVVPPSSRVLTWNADRLYTRGLAGSGFVADVVIMPTRVSFMRTELREGAVNGVATGYYDSVVHWNGDPHPPTAWLSPDAMNSGLIDTIGADPPGLPAPFGFGTFLWAIPQSFRTPGTTGNGTQYSTANQTYVMIGPTGMETTIKEGASRIRTP
jgi:hypothetical protein